MATIEEVSRLANVSPATVSRVLNNTVPVREATRKRMLQAVDALNYQPDAFARALVTKRSGGIGVTVNHLSSPYYGTVMEGIESVIEQAGMHLLVSSGHADTASERAAVEFLMQRRADALIIQVEATPEQALLGWAAQTALTS
jgi:LacI family transcriptional regulator